MTIKQSLISARFVTTIGHFIALLVLFSTVDNNIALGLPDNYTSSERHSAATTAWVSFVVTSYDLPFAIIG